MPGKFQTIDHPISNHHCTCIEINSLGIMIEGKSGAGKTSLALGLLDAARTRNAEFKFICDDQAMLHTVDNELWATAPKPLAGKVELFGAGIANIEHSAQCRIGLVCNLVNQQEIERYPAATSCRRLGIDLDYVEAPKQHEAQGVRIILNKLSLPL